MNYREIENRIETETIVNDIVLNQIADHGANNVFNSALSDEQDCELQELAKEKIHELEVSHPEATE